MNTLNIWWDCYTPRVESQLIRDLLLLKTYGEIAVCLFNKELPESLEYALDTLEVNVTKTPGVESKAYLTKDTEELPEGFVEPLVQKLYLEPSAKVLTKPGTPLVVDPPYVVPAPPQLSPNHMVEPPRTRNTILSPWLTN